MFDRKLFLICAATIELISQTVSSKKCVYVRFGDDIYSRENDLVECSNVPSMNELTAEIKPDWNRLIIINEIHNTFTTAAESYPSFEYIQHLDLSQAGILNAGDYGFRGFSQLIELNISSTHTTTLKNDWFSRSNNIETLDVSWNKLSALEQNNLLTLTKVVVANFSHNDIDEIETLAFSPLRRMKMLDLSSNRITGVSDLGDLTSLEVLKLDDNFLFELPPNGFSKLTGLQTLTLSGNRISSVQKYCFNGLQSLRQLNISGNMITDITQDLFVGFSTIRLQELDLKSNYIKTVESNAFQELNFLLILDLSGNRMEELRATAFNGLNLLRKLFLSKNGIGNIPANTFEALENLEELDLSGNSLRSFSGIVFGHSVSSSPRKLRKVLLKQNHLTVIHPHTFNHTPNLEYLSLSFNSIDKFDENLFLPLAKLKKLHINHNKIVELSARLFNTTILLQELYIDHNRLTFFPDISNDFSRLMKVSLEGNPWQCPCLNAILSWLTDRGTDYKRTTDSPYYKGKKPICVFASTYDCVRDIDVVNEHRIVEKYENALNLH